MKRYLLDTNAVSDLLDTEPKVVDRASNARRQGARVGTCVPVLAELHYGVEYSASRDKNMQRLKRGTSRLKVWPFDESAAAEFGRIYADLRRRGRVIGIIDMMTAAVARKLGGCTVVSSDSDFRSIPGLDVEDWTK